jgi:hypothetical protein
MGVYGPEWQLWIWIAVVGLLVLGAVVVAAIGRSRFATLAPQHIAAATLIGLLTWALLQQLPSMILTLTGTYAGIDSAPSKAVHQAFVALHALVAVGGVLAALGLLRRHAWAVVLGIAVCAASIGTSLITIGNFFESMDGFGGIAPEFTWFWISVLLQPVPAIVGLVLLLWPFAAGTLRPLRTERDRERRRADGIVDADSEEAVGVEWPEWSRTAHDRG